MELQALDTTKPSESHIGNRMLWIIWMQWICNDLNILPHLCMSVCVFVDSCFEGMSQESHLLQSHQANAFLKLLFCVRTHTFYSQTGYPAAPRPLACDRGQGAPLFSLWFSYYTQINAVELLWHPRALDPERVRTEFLYLLSVSLSPSLSATISLYFTVCPTDAHILVHDVAHLFRRCQPNK